MRNLLVHWSKSNVNGETRLSMKWNTFTSCRNRIHKSLSLFPREGTLLLCLFTWFFFSMFIMILHSKVKIDKSSLFLLLILDFFCLGAFWAHIRNFQNLKLVLENPIALLPFFPSPFMHPHIWIWLWQLPHSFWKMASHTYLTVKDKKWHAYLSA